jgi:hypothetical protein
VNLIFGNDTGLDYWNQTKDYLVPILDKNNTYSMVTLDLYRIKIKFTSLFSLHILSVQLIYLKNMIKQKLFLCTLHHKTHTHRLK